MKWHTPPIRIGDRRVRTFFALIPRPCDDEQTRWLERVTVVEEFTSDWDGVYWRPMQYWAARPEEAPDAR